MSTETRNVKVDLGCFGCLLEVVGILGLIYIVTHWDVVSKLVFGA